MNYHELKAIRIDDNEVATHFKQWLEPYQKESMMIRLNQTTGALMIDVEEVSRHQKEAYLRRMIELGMTVHVQFHSHKQQHLTIPLMVNDLNDSILTHRETEHLNYISLEDGVIQAKLSPPSPFVLKMWFGELGTQVLKQLSNELSVEAQQDFIKEFVRFSSTLIGLNNKRATTRIINHYKKGNRSIRKQNQPLHSAVVLFSAYQEENEAWNWSHVGSGTHFGILHILMLLFVTLPFNDQTKRNLLSNIPEKGFELAIFEAIFENKNSSEINN